MSSSESNNSTNSNLHRQLQKKFCDTSSPHFNLFSPDFKPTSVISTMTFDNSLSSSSEKNKNRSVSLQKLSFSQSVWPENVLALSAPNDGSSMKFDICATLVSICNITGQILPVPWPSSMVKASEAKEGPNLTVGFQKIQSGNGQNSSNNIFSRTRNNRGEVEEGMNIADDDAHQFLDYFSMMKTKTDKNDYDDDQKEIKFPNCSLRMTAARSFSFVSVVDELTWACSSSSNSSKNNSSNSLTVLRNTPMVNVNVVTSAKNKWLASSAGKDNNNSSSSIITLVFVCGVKLLDYSKLWNSPHLRNLDVNKNKSDSGICNQNQQQQQQAASIVEKTKTHKLILLREEDDDDDPWALRGGVWVISSSTKNTSANSSTKLSQDGENSNNISQKLSSSISVSSSSRLGSRFKNLAAMEPSTAIDAAASSTTEENTNISTSSKNPFGSNPFLRNNNHNSNASSTNNNHRSNNDQEDDVVQAEASVVSLRCPISLQIISTPVKGKSCEHDACFELSTFVHQSILASSWNCPHCDRACYFGQLAVDDVIESALFELRKENEELIKNQSDEQSSKRNRVTTKNEDGADDDDDDDDDDEQVVAFDRILVYPAVKGQSARKWEKFK